MRVNLPDGTPIRGSSLADRLVDNPERDFGLYLDPCWKPVWPADQIVWPDFGVPTHPETAQQQIRQAFERARNGERVEIGCLGGLGRTGTVLACFAVLAGFEPADAIRWVRTDYDRGAIETVDQERWIHWFAARLKEDECAP